VRINFPDLSFSFFLSLPSAAQVILTTPRGQGEGAKGFRKARQEYGGDDFSFFDAHEVPTMDAYHGVAAAFATVFVATRHTWRRIVP